MADSDSSITILIKAVADTTGYRMNEAEAAKLKANIAETGVAAGKLNEKVEEGGKAAEKSEISHRALHQILHLIGKESGPAAGAALSGLAAAATGSMLFAIGAVRELFEWIGQARDRAQHFRDLMEEKLDLSDMVADINDVKEAVDSTSEQVDKFFANLTAKAAGKDGFRKIADDQIAHLTRVAAAQKKMADAEADQDKARLDYLKSTKAISEEDYKSGIAAVNALKSKKDESITGNLDSQSTAALHFALMNTLAREEGASRNLNAAKGEPFNEQRMKTLRELLKKTQGVMADKEKGQMEGGGFWSQYGDALLNMFSHPFETSGHFRARRNEELSASMTETRGNEGSLQKQLNEREGPARENAEKIKQLEETITTLKSDQEALQSELAKRSDQQSIDKNLSVEMGKLKTTTEKTHDSSLVLLKNIVSSHGDFNKALDDLHRDLKELDSRSRRVWQ